jgi:hypothetical protein
VDVGLDLHTVNLIAAVKAGNAGLLNCPIEAAANTAIHCHMGNVALRTGQTLHTNGNNSIVRFLEKEGNKLIMPDYQNGWKMPK